MVHSNDAKVDRSRPPPTHRVTSLTALQQKVVEAHTTFSSNREAGQHNVWVCYDGLCWVEWEFRARSNSLTPSGLLSLENHLQGYLGYFCLEVETVDAVEARDTGYRFAFKFVFSTGVKLYEPWEAPSHGWWGAVLVAARCHVCEGFPPDIRAILALFEYVPPVS